MFASGVVKAPIIAKITIPKQQQTPSVIIKSISIDNKPINAKMSIIAKIIYPIII